MLIPVGHGFILCNVGLNVRKESLLCVRFFPESYCWAVGNRGRRCVCEASLWKSIYWCGDNPQWAKGQVGQDCWISGEENHHELKGWIATEPGWKSKCKLHGVLGMRTFIVALCKDRWLYLFFIISIFLDIRLIMRLYQRGKPGLSVFPSHTNRYTCTRDRKSVV